MKAEELKAVSDAKWESFYRASTAAGVWFVAFVAVLALGKGSDGGGFSVVLSVISFGFAFVLGLLMFIAMLEASKATREFSDVTKAAKINEQIGNNEHV